MKWFRLKKRIRLNPAMLDPYRQLNIRQARAKWREVGRPTAAELMDGARIKAAKSNSEWEEITGYKDTSVETRTVRLRRLAIVCAVALLLALFMTFTVPGRALAQTIYNAITTIIGDMLYIQNSNSPLNNEPQYQSSESSINTTLSAINKQLNRPLLYLKGADYILKSAVISDGGYKGLVVELNYAIDTTDIYITQRWPLNDQPIDASIGMSNGLYHEAHSGMGLSFIGAYTENDQSYVGSIIMDSEDVSIRISNASSLSAIDKIVHDIDFYL